jgi:hypothetical protein
MSQGKQESIRCIATRNGVPCSLEKVECRVAGFRYRGTVLFALPVPPSDPHVFRSAQAADRACERSHRLSRKLRESIIRDFVLQSFPALQPFAVKARYQSKIHKAKK